VFTDICTVFCRELFLYYLIDVRRDWRTLRAHRSAGWKPLQTQLDDLTSSLDALK
jgi:hypothetical protein